LRAHDTAGQRHGSPRPLQFGFLPKGLQPAVQRLDRAFGFLREDACGHHCQRAVAVHKDQWAGARQIARVVQHLCEFGIARSRQGIILKGAGRADVLENPGYLIGAGPLIIVDRDGSLAMMAAGILSQKTKRPIKALHGGLEAFWEESELKGAVRAVPLPSGGARPQAVPGAGSAPRPATPAPTPSAPATKKRKSAGC